MKILKILLYIVLGIVVLLAALGIFGKKSYHVERSIDIAAPKGMVYEYARFFKNFNEWSPWSPLDPKMTSSITGTDGEAGVLYEWKGNEDVGAGTQKITAITADRIDYEVHFKEPFESTSPVFMTFEDKDSLTKVTWGFDMHIAFPWNGFAMFTDMDAAIGRDYENGLANLKKILEAKAQERYLGLRANEVQMPQQTYAMIRQTVEMPAAGAFFGANLPKILEAVQKGGVAMSGPPCGLYWAWDETTKKTDMAAAIPVAEAKNFGKNIQVLTLDAGAAMVIDYYGKYDSIGRAHLSLDAWIADKGLKSKSPVIESYITDPMKEPDTSKWLTKVIYFTEQK
jgi:effector-binding domain-containing protein